MALQADYRVNENQVMPNCYWKIGKEDGVRGGVWDIECKIYCYETKADADQNQNELFIYDFLFFYDHGNLDNLFTQIYNELKQNHPLFEDAVDV